MRHYMQKTGAKMLRGLAVAAGLSALPAVTLADVPADLTADYTAAVDIFLQGGQDGPQAQLAEIEALLPTLEGRWVRSVQLFLGGPLDADLMSVACVQAVEELAVVDRFTLRMTRMGRGEATRAVSTLTYIGGSSFLRVMDVEGTLDFLSGGQPDRLPETVLTGLLSGNQGVVQLYPIGADVVVIVPVGGPADIMVRCPAE